MKRSPKARKTNKEEEEEERAFQTINRIVQLQNDPLSFIPTMRNIITVPGDGDCLFHALTHELNRTNLYLGNQYRLRQLICDKLQELLDINQLEEHLYDVLGGMDNSYYKPFGKYIQNMRKSGLWGGDLEISVIPLIFEGMNLEIWMKPQKGSQNLSILSARSSGDNSNTIRLFNTRTLRKGDIGNHFDVVSFYKQPTRVGRRKSSPSPRRASPPPPITTITPFNKPMTFEQVEDVWNKQILEIANFTTSLINSKDRHDKSLLFHAASVGNIIGVRMLLYIGVDINDQCTETKISPLMIACRGKSPTWIDNDENTIVHNFELVVTELLQNWSDDELKDINNKSALEYALDAPINSENIVNIIVNRR